MIIIQLFYLFIIIIFYSNLIDFLRLPLDLSFVVPSTFVPPPSSVLQFLQPVYHISLFSLLHSKTKIYFHRFLRQVSIGRVQTYPPIVFVRLTFYSKFSKRFRYLHPSLDLLSNPFLKLIVQSLSCFRCKLLSNRHENRKYQKSTYFQ